MNVDRYLLIKTAAASVRDDILEARAPDLLFGRTFEFGKPCCVGGYILIRAGYKPPLAIFGGATRTGLLDEFLEEPCPTWLKWAWLDMETANDDDSLSKVNRLRYIVAAINRLLQAIDKNHR